MRSTAPRIPRLLWPGKTTRRCRSVRPLVLREYYPGGGEPPAAGGRGRCPLPPAKPCRPWTRHLGGVGEGEDLAGRLPFGVPDSAEWTNLLVRADNRVLLSSLLHGPLRRVLDQAGGIRLLYADPPFAAGLNFCMPVGPDKAADPPLALAYSDTWGNSLAPFLDMMYERLLLLRDLLAPDATIFLHCDYRTAPHMRLLLDEIFGPEHFLGDIVWHYTGGGRAKRWFSRKHDRILHYARSEHWTFNLDELRVPYKPDSGYAKGGITSAAGKRYLPNPAGTPVDDVWDIPMLNPMAHERNNYPTQKPEALLERILLAASRPGDLVADVFCGSGTLPAVADRMGRKWLAADSSALAVHVTRKRLLANPTAAPFALAELGPPAPRRAKKQTPTHAAQAENKQHQAELHSAPFAYTLEAVKAICRRHADSVAVELAGFRVLSAAALPEQVRELAADWRTWLDFWSVSLAPGPVLAWQEDGAGLPPPHVLWQAFRSRQGLPATRTPLLSLPSEYNGGLLLTLVDIFANETRLPLAGPYSRSSRR